MANNSNYSPLYLPNEQICVSYSDTIMSYDYLGLNANTAKKVYFLSIDDIADLPCRKLGGWGCGNSKYYDPDHLKDFELINSFVCLDFHVSFGLE